ncbi:MAG: hypothetical protein ACOCWG_06115, partial [bacterium]
MISYRSLRSTIGRYLINLPGWRTDRKLVVFESDDWGSIRIPSKGVYDKLRTKVGKMENNPFNRFDCLETENDLSDLFEHLKKHTDKNGNHPIITANFVVANPDFDKIRNLNYEMYYYELISETYKRNKNSYKSFELIKEGIKEGLFNPQYHGREHLNVEQWMYLLQQVDKD